MIKNKCGFSYRVALALLTLFVSVGMVALGTASALELPIGVKPGEKKYPLPRLRLAVTVGGDYSDNVNTAPGRDSKGMMLRVTPEVNLEMPSFLSQQFGNKKLYLEGGYRYGYLGVNGRKIDFHHNTHTANAGLRYSLTPKASLGSTYVFQRDEYPFAASGDTYNLNNVNTQLKVELTKRLTLEPYYTYQGFNDTGLDADRSIAVLNDYSDNRVGWDSQYRVSPKLALIGHSEYANRAFHKSDLKDYQSYGGRGGLSLQLTKKINAWGSGGYIRRYYDKGKDLGSYLWDAHLQYIPSRKLVTEMFYLYDLEDTFVTSFLVNRASPSVVDFIPRQYRAINVQRLGGKMGLTLSDKDRIDTGLTYQFEYADASQFVQAPTTPVKLVERQYMVNVAYSHAFAQWLRLYLEYANIGRNANIASNFRANIFSFGVRLGW